MNGRIRIVGEGATLPTKPIGSRWLWNPQAAGYSQSLKAEPCEIVSYDVPPEWKPCVDWHHKYVVKLDSGGAKVFANECALIALPTQPNGAAVSEGTDG